MELFALLIGLFFLVTIFLPWVNQARFGSVRDDIDRLQARIRDLEDKLYGDDEIKHSKPRSLSQLSQTVREQTGNNVSDAYKEEWEGRAQRVEEESTQKSIEECLESDTPVISVPPFPKTDWAQKAQNTFEQNIATKLPVWVGSISLIFAAFFLVKYSIEFGWLGPVARICLGGLFGAGLLAVGQLVSKRTEMPNALRICQGLIGAGLVGLYVSLYAAIHLYGLIPSVLGFGGMSIVTGMAVILSLRHGQPIAVFGLIGGLLTPALIGSDEPNAMALFAYLFLLFSGLFVVLIRKEWWALSIIALLGVFGWSAFWFMLVFAASDAFVLVLFAMMLTAVVLAATGKRIADDNLTDHEKYHVHALNTAAIAGGVVTIFWLSLEVTLGLFDWSMLGLLGMALMALSYFQPEIYRKPFLAKLISSLVLLLFWAQGVALGDALSVIVGMSVIYIGGSALLMRRVSDPRFWASIQTATALSLYLISYWILDLPAWFMQSFGIFWGIFSLILASLSIYQAADIRAKFKADNDIQEHLVAIYSLAASAFISLGLVIELPWAYVPVAIAGQVAATAWIFGRTNIHFLQNIMYLLAFVFVAMNYEQIALFGMIVLESLIGELLSSYFLSDFVLNAPLVNLGVPAVLFYTAFAIARRVSDFDHKLAHALFGTANILALCTAYYVFREAFHSGAEHAFSSETGFIGRGIITITLAGAGAGVIEFIRKHDIQFLKPWGVAIFGLAITRFVYFDFMLYNPYWSHEQFVGNIPLLNGVTFTYGLGLLAVVWAIRDRDVIAKTGFMHKLYCAIAIASVFAVTSLNVRQYFHGGFLEQGSMGSAELYAYSVVWLLTGLAFLTAGIKFKNKTARMTSLAFVALAVVKVFLFDAAELEGLYRVFSFLGLGVSLIGLSTFYTRFVFNGEKQKGERNA